MESFIIACTPIIVVAMQIWATRDRRRGAREVEVNSDRRAAELGSQSAEIHALVNDRLDTALAKIESLELELRKLRGDGR